MSDRWCDDCSWPYECMGANACRRNEMGERRSAAPAEVADVIADEIRLGGVCFVAGHGPMPVLPNCVDGGPCLNAGVCDAHKECERDRRMVRALRGAPSVGVGTGFLTFGQLAAFFGEGGDK